MMYIARMTLLTEALLYRRSNSKAVNRGNASKHYTRTLFFVTDSPSDSTDLL
jgi:hypothetical protein